MSRPHPLPSLHCRIALVSNESGHSIRGARPRPVENGNGDVSEAPICSGVHRKVIALVADQLRSHRRKARCSARAAALAAACARSADARRFPPGGAGVDHARRSLRRRLDEDARDGPPRGRQPTQAPWPTMTWSLQDDSSPEELAAVGESSGEVLTVNGERSLTPSRRTAPAGHNLAAGAPAEDGALAAPRGAAAAEAPGPSPAGAGGAALPATARLGGDGAGPARDAGGAGVRERARRVCCSFVAKCWCTPCSPLSQDIVSVSEGRL